MDNFFVFFVTYVHKKGRAFKPGQFFTDDIYKSLFDLEFVLMECDFVQILGLAS